MSGPASAYAADRSAACAGVPGCKVRLIWPSMKRPREGLWQEPNVEEPRRTGEVPPPTRSRILGSSDKGGRRGRAAVYEGHLSSIGAEAPWGRCGGGVVGARPLNVPGSGLCPTIRTVRRALHGLSIRRPVWRMRCLCRSTQPGLLLCGHRHLSGSAANLPEQHRLRPMVR
jgi:hypothetical protein